VLELRRVNLPTTVVDMAGDVLRSFSTLRVSGNLMSGLPLRRATL
jgi:hypothetical protein